MTTPSTLSDSRPRGIDVSGHQPIIDWGKIASEGVSFAFIKATESTTLVDRSFSSHWMDAKKAGLLRGAYHFFRPQHDAVAQAQLFLSQLLDRGELPPVLDVEVVDGVPFAKVAEGVSTWIDYVVRYTGRTIIYTSPGFWNLLPAVPNLAKSDLWVAHWGIASPAKVQGWSNWRFWQYTDRATSSGIPGSAWVDEDRYTGAAADLASYSDEFIKNLPAIGDVHFDLGTTIDIQRALNVLKVAVPKLAEDGIWGPQTKAAIEAFQASVRLTADGIVGPKTLAALRAALH